MALLWLLPMSRVLVLTFLQTQGLIWAFINAREWDRVGKMHPLLNVTVTQALEIRALGEMRDVSGTLIKKTKNTERRHNFFFKHLSRSGTFHNSFLVLTINLIKGAFRPRFLEEVQVSERAWKQIKVTQVVNTCVWT